MKRFAALVAVFLFCSVLSQAQRTPVVTSVQDLPSLLRTPSNAGTDFYFSFPPCYVEESVGNENSCKVFVASEIEQDITVEVPGKNWTMTKVAVANDVVEFILPVDVAQAFLKQGKEKAPAENIYRQAAVHVFSQSPVIVYGVTRYNYTSDGFLALPVSALGAEYIVASYPQFTATGTGFQLVSETTISAAYDETEVTFEMGGNAQSTTSGGLKPGETRTFMMQRGDVLSFASNGDNQDISGSYITSSKPVGVVSGNQCANIPGGVAFCDFISEMEIPTYTWGLEYHVTPFFGRKKNPIIRIYAKEENTTVYRDGVQWLVLPRGNRMIDNGFAERRSDDSVPRSVVISADKPIYVVEYNTGQADDGISSDPFQLVLTPLEQYQNEIVFCTPGAKGGKNNFKKHYVNLIYQVAADSTIPDDLEFAIVNNGQFEWNKVTTFGENPGQIFGVPVNGATYACKQLILPGDGVYRIRANTPLAAYSYGFSNYDSYGFPAGAAFIDNTVKDTETPLLSVAPKSADGEVTGTVTDYPQDPKLRSNLGLISMGIDANYNYQFSYGKSIAYIAGQSQTTDWSLKVIDKSKDARAVLHFADRSGNDTTILVEYQSASGIEDDIRTNGNTVSECSFTVSPNPIGASGGTVEFTLLARSKADISIYSPIGEKVVTLVNSTFDGGNYQAAIPVERLSAGTYRVRMTAGESTIEQSLVIVK